MGHGSATATAAAALCGAALLARGGGDVGALWHPPAQGDVNNLTLALGGRGVYGFIFNSSTTPDARYGTYNWCNMPHVRRAEYERAPAGFELKYVELMHRHHKRTPYASNGFPVEADVWDCDDVRLFLYGEPAAGPAPCRARRQGYTSAVNPFVAAGLRGSCSFPQITAEGLVDSWQHGADLYHVYHDLLGLLPARDDAHFGSAVRYRVTNNPITSQVAGMLISGMWRTADPAPLMIQPERVDSLEPQYSCPAASRLFRDIKSDSNQLWKKHLAESAGLYRTLDNISQVPPDDAGFHASLDHYYDNLSARQCHGKPLPCKIVNGSATSTCVTQELADAVYRMGNWEYSHVYRDHPDSLLASAASLGVWVAELATHLRDVVKGSTDVVYFHNIAHDGSVSRLLSILQLDSMVWPGMGSEVVFELYKHSSQQPGARAAPTTAHGKQHGCQHATQPSSACCAATASAAPPLASQPARSCQCNASATAAAAPATTPLPSESGYYVRVLFGAKVLRSSNPTLGLMDMLPLETLLKYLDRLVGEGASMVKARCQG